MIIMVDPYLKHMHSRLVTPPNEVVGLNGLSKDSEDGVRDLSFTVCLISHSP